MQGGRARAAAEGAGGGEAAARDEVGVRCRRRVRRSRRRRGEPRRRRRRPRQLQRRPSASPALMAGLIDQKATLDESTIRKAIADIEHDT